MKEILPFGHFWASNYGGAGGGSPGIYEQAQLYMDFRANQARLNGVWSSAASLLTYNRNSVGYIDDTAGNWTQVSNVNTPRMSNKGLLIEEPRTNYIRNNTMVGAVTGSPGTSPTNWLISAVPGLAINIVGVGNDHGVDYVDVRWFGTATAGGNLVVFFEPQGVIAAAPGQQWVLSCFLAAVGGSHANIQDLHAFAYEFDAGNVFLRVDETLPFGLPGASLQRYGGPLLALLGASTANIRPGVYYIVPAAGPIDITLRIGWPQLELNAAAIPTSPMTTTGVAAYTRSQDMAEVTGFVPTVPATLWCEFMVPYGPVSSAFPGIVNIHGTNADTDRMGLFYGGAAMTPQLSVSVGTVAQAGGVGAAMVAGQIAKSAATMNTNDFSFCSGGGAVQLDVAGAIVSPIVKIAIGRLGSASNFASGYIRRIAYWNTRLSDALLQAITAP